MTGAATTTLQDMHDLPVEADQFPQTQIKFGQRLTEYVRLLTRQNELFSMQRKADENTLSVVLKREWPKITGWEAEADLMIGHVMTVIKSIPANVISPTPTMTVRVLVSPRQIDASHLPNPDEFIAVATVDGKSGTLQSRILPPSESAPSLVDLEVPFGILIMAGRSLPIFNESVDNRAVGLDFGGPYQTRERDSFEEQNTSTDSFVGERLSQLLQPGPANPSRVSEFFELYPFNPNKPSPPVEDRPANAYAALATAAVVGAGAAALLSHEQKQGQKQAVEQAQKQTQEQANKSVGALNQAGAKSDHDAVVASQMAISARNEETRRTIARQQVESDLARGERRVEDEEAVLMRNNPAAEGVILESGQTALGLLREDASVAEARISSVPENVGLDADGIALGIGSEMAAPELTTANLEERNIGTLDNTDDYNIEAIQAPGSAELSEQAALASEGITNPELAEAITAPEAAIAAGQPVEPIQNEFAEANTETTASGETATVEEAVTSDSVGADTNPAITETTREAVNEAEPTGQVEQTAQEAAIDFQAKPAAGASAEIPEPVTQEEQIKGAAEQQKREGFNNEDMPDSEEPETPKQEQVGEDSSQSTNERPQETRAEQGQEPARAEPQQENAADTRPSDSTERMDRMESADGRAEVSDRETRIESNRADDAGYRQDVENQQSSAEEINRAAGADIVDHNGNQMGAAQSDPSQNANQAAAQYGAASAGGYGTGHAVTHQVVATPGVDAATKGAVANGAAVHATAANAAAGHGVMQETALHQLSESAAAAGVTHQTLMSGNLSAQGVQSSLGATAASGASLHPVHAAAISDQAHAMNAKVVSASVPETVRGTPMDRAFMQDIPGMETPLTGPSLSAHAAQVAQAGAAVIPVGGMETKMQMQATMASIDQVTPYVGAAVLAKETASKQRIAKAKRKQKSISPNDAPLPQSKEARKVKTKPKELRTSMPQPEEPEEAPEPQPASFPTPEIG